MQDFTRRWRTESEHTQTNGNLLWSTEHPIAHKLSVMWMFLEQMSVITDAVDRQDEEERSRRVSYKLFTMGHE